MSSSYRHLTTYLDEYYLGLPVNVSDEKPIYEEIISKTYEELTKLIAMYTRTVVTRMDLIPEKNNAQSIDMTKFCKSFTRILKTKYKTEVAYQWVREYGANKYNQGLHWHLWVGVKNTNEARPLTQAREVQELIATKWAEFAGLSPRTQSAGTFYLQRNKLSPSARANEQKLISRDEKGVLINIEKLVTRKNNSGVALGGVIDECFYAISYLAKANTKIRTLESKSKKVFSASNISTRHIKDSNRKLEVESQLVKIQNHLNQKIQPVAIDAKVVQSYSNKAGVRFKLNALKKRENHIKEWLKKKRVQEGMP